jgi:hypothetical protein
MAGRKKSAMTAMLLTAAAGGMIVPAAHAVAPIPTVDEANEGDFSGSYNDPTLLPDGTQRVIGGLASPTDDHDDAFMIGGYHWSSQIKVQYEISGSDGAEFIIDVYDYNNGGDPVNIYPDPRQQGQVPVSNGTFYVTVPASGQFTFDVVNISDNNAETVGAVNYTITVPAVPEPSAGLLALGALSALVAKRRARK